MANEIPIRNIYYLLCYAWNRLAEGELVDVSGVDSNELVDLFATVLINGVNHTMRRGMDRGYEAYEEELSGLRGKIDVAITTRRMLMSQGKAYCHYDEFTINTLPNQIIKSTIKNLTKAPNLDKSLRTKLVTIHRELHGIDDIALSKFHFRNVQLHSNNRFYRFLINICEIIQSSWLVDEASGQYKFRDFIRDDRAMAHLYESFILNFYKMELKGAEVKKERLYWAATSKTDPELKFLPTMETDISIRDGKRTLIIDAKYYSQTLQSYYDKQTIHSSNIYQIYTYLSNIKTRGGTDSNAEGMLLYPVVNQELREKYEMNGSKIHICTLNLSNDWKNIKSELLNIVRYE